MLSVPGRFGDCFRIVFFFASKKTRPGKIGIHARKNAVPDFFSGACGGKGANFITADHNGRRWNWETDAQQVARIKAVNSYAGYAAANPAPAERMELRIPPDPEPMPWQEVGAGPRSYRMPRPKAQEVLAVEELDRFIKHGRPIEKALNLLKLNGYRTNLQVETENVLLKKFDARIDHDETDSAYFYLKDAEGNITGKIVRDSVFHNQYLNKTNRPDANGRNLNGAHMCQTTCTAMSLGKEGVSVHPDTLLEEWDQGRGRRPSMYTRNITEFAAEKYTGGDYIYKYKNRNASNPSNHDEIRALIDRGIVVHVPNFLTRGSGHQITIIGYDDSRRTWIVSDPAGNRFTTGYGRNAARQHPKAGLGAEYPYHRYGIGRRRIYWLEEAEAD